MEIIRNDGGNYFTDSGIWLVEVDDHIYYSEETGKYYEELGSFLEVIEYDLH